LTIFEATAATKIWLKIGLMMQYSRKTANNRWLEKIFVGKNIAIAQ
jgi:hypothetical protein